MLESSSRIYLLAWCAYRRTCYCRHNVPLSHHRRPLRLFRRFPITHDVQPFPTREEIALDLALYNWGPQPGNTTPPPLRPVRRLETLVIVRLFVHVCTWASLKFLTGLGRPYSTAHSHKPSRRQHKLQQHLNHLFPFSPLLLSLYINSIAFVAFSVGNYFELFWEIYWSITTTYTRDTRKIEKWHRAYVRSPWSA